MFRLVANAAGDFEAISDGAHVDRHRHALGSELLEDDLGRGSVGDDVAAVRGDEAVDGLDADGA
jgi:hypothetical protein